MSNLSINKIIEQTLEEKIISGEYAVDSKIPTEKELTEIYKASRTTVRQALANLVSRGFLYRTPGKGTFVSKTQKIEHSNRLESFADEMKKIGKTANTNILSFSVTYSTKKIAKSLKINDGEPIYEFKIIRSANDTPIIYEHTYMSVNAYPTLSMEDLRKSKYKYVENYKKIKIAYVHQGIEPVQATEELATKLKIPSGSSILKVINTTFLDNGEVMDYTIMYVNTQEMSFNVIRSRE